MSSAPQRLGCVSTFHSIGNGQLYPRALHLPASSSSSVGPLTLNPSDIILPHVAGATLEFGRGPRSAVCQAAPARSQPRDTSAQADSDWEVPDSLGERGTRDKVPLAATSRSLDSLDGLKPA
jgi:hypothetical protein